MTPTATSPRRELGDVRVGAVGADTYIRANADRIPNYGERHRAGETISSSFVESAVNQVISKRYGEETTEPESWCGGSRSPACSRRLSNSRGNNPLTAGTPAPLPWRHDLGRWWSP